MWTRFFDMYSGGRSKEKWELIYIEASEEEAKVIFYNRFGHNPERVTCTCCGEDYSIDSQKSLAQVTGYDRGCDYVENKYVERENPKYSFNKYMKLKDYIKKDNVKIIKKSEIKKSERVGEVPQQGYVWQN